MQGSTLQYVHQDSLSGTSVTTSSTGAVTGTITYFPFGATRSGSVPTDEKFTGQRLDSTGLYYYNARYYDPTIGRFISPDSDVSDPEDPQSLNRYSYVLNNPLTLTDPTGRQAELDEYMEMQVLAGSSSDTLSSAISSDTAAEYSGATDQYMEYATLAGYTDQIQQDLLAATGLPQFAPQTPAATTNTATSQPVVVPFSVTNSPTGVFEPGIADNPGSSIAAGTTTISGAATYSQGTLSVSVSVTYTGEEQDFQNIVVSYAAQVDLAGTPYTMDLTPPQNSILPAFSRSFSGGMEIPDVSSTAQASLKISVGARDLNAQIDEPSNKVVVPSSWVVDLATGQISTDYIDWLR